VLLRSGMLKEPYMTINEPYFTPPKRPTHDYAALSDGHNRIVMGRHKSIGALLLVVERAALESEEQAALGASPGWL
jgi:hypothetical protein